MNHLKRTIKNVHKLQSILDGAKKGKYSIR